VSGTTPYRSRSGVSLFKKIQYQSKQHPGVKYFECAGPAINSNLKELKSFCDLMISSNLKAYWGGNALIQPGMDRETLIKMKEAGCITLTMGIESGSQRILDRMGKHYTVADCSRIIKECSELNIAVYANFIIGFPGESHSDFEDTCEFIKKNAPYIKYVGSRSPCWVSPYTKIYNNPDKYEIDYSRTKDSKRCVQDWLDKGQPDNNYEIRLLKTKVFAELVKSVGLQHEYDRIDK